MSFLSILLLFNTSFASAPANEKIVLPPLSVTWDSSMTPVFVGLEGEQGTKIKKQKRASLKRVKYVGQKLTLLFIPKHKNLAPIKILIPDSLNEFHIAKELAAPIMKNDFWLWGNTLESKCGGNASLSMRFLYKKGFYKNLSGLFAWKIKRDQLPRETTFYILPSVSIDMPSNIKSDIFAQANKRHTTKCELHTGGYCPFVFNLKTPEKGFKTKVHFYGNTNSVSDFNCPI